MVLSDINRLCLNVKKTKYILFRPRNYTTNISQNRIYLNGEEVDQISNINIETSFKFLGLHVDESLTWKYHVKKVCARIARSNYILNKVKNFLPYSTLNTLYAAIVQSHINYGLIIWGNSTSINQLIKLQKKSIRIINNKPYNYHTEPLFKKSNILKIQDQYKLNILIFMHQLKHHKLPESFDCLTFFNPEHIQETRQVNLANCYRFRTSFTSRMPFHQFPREWNKLKYEIRETTYLRSFKRKISTTFLNEYSSSVRCENVRCMQCLPV